MVYKKRGQISTEYIIITSFILFLVLSALGVAMFYSNEIRDSIKFSQLQSFSQKITSIAESVYYSGEPSRTTTDVYMPKGVNSVSVQGREISFDISTATGNNLISFTSNVNLTGSISPTEGVKKISIVAKQDHVEISG